MCFAKGVVKIFGRDFNLLERALDFRQAKHTIILSNIANVDTPDYRPRDLYFQNVLEDMVKPKPKKFLPLRRTDPRHLPRISPPPPRPVVYYTGSGFGNDINGVDIDLEMARLAKNQIAYRATAQFLTEKFAKLRLALGRR